MQLASQSFQEAIHNHLTNEGFLAHPRPDIPLLQTLGFPFLKTLAEQELMQYNSDAYLHYRYLLFSIESLERYACSWKGGVLEHWQQLDTMFPDQIERGYQMIVQSYSGATVSILGQDGRTLELTSNTSFKAMSAQTDLTWFIQFVVAFPMTQTHESKPLESLTDPLHRLDFIRANSEIFHNQFRQLLTE